MASLQSFISGVFVSVHVFVFVTNVIISVLNETGYLFRFFFFFSDTYARVLCLVAEKTNGKVKRASSEISVSPFYVSNLCRFSEIEVS